MGHVRIGFLPHTRQWNAIVNQLSSYDNDSNAVAVIADRTLDAVRKEFDGLQYDESIVKAIGYLATIIVSSRQEDQIAFLQERLKSLRYAFDNGFSTSISCEPLLDDHFDDLYEKVSPYVNGSLWIGKMNSAVKRVRDNTGGMFPMEKVQELVASQSDEKILALFLKNRNNPLIEWKESIKKVAIAHGYEV